MRLFAVTLWALVGSACLPIDTEIEQLYAGLKEARLHSCPVEESMCSDLQAANHCSPALVSGGVLAVDESTEHNDGHHQCLLRCADNEHCPVGYRCVDRQHDENTKLCVRETLCRGNAHCTNPFYGLGMIDSVCAEAPIPVCRNRLRERCERDSDCSDLHSQATCYMKRCEYPGDLQSNGTACPEEQLYTGQCKAREPLNLADLWKQIEREGHGMNPCQEVGTPCDTSHGDQGACARVYDNNLRCHPVGNESTGCPGGFVEQRLPVEGIDGLVLCIPKIPCRSTTAAIADQTSRGHTQLSCELTGTECTGRSNLCVDQVVLSCAEDSDCRSGFSCYLGVCVATTRSGACDDSTNVERTWVHTCEVPEISL